MKKLSLLAIILLISLGGVNAQKKLVKVSPWIEANVPQEVLAAMETKNPGLNMSQHLTAAVDKAKKVKNGNKIYSWSSPTYHVQYKGKNYRKTEVYDKEGNLIHSKESMFNAAMPREVYRYIGREHNGWLIKRTEIIKKVETGAATARHTVQYKVLLQHGKKKQWVLLNEQGGLYSRR
ncbi:hypothetical protein [Cesiribacter sp. SM1]|uniref:hypothetical protein n=1 Tax=Cesiribacter sp. SM1 TaxID=2861196 RepID=UPI001CD7AC05|nr:hypothetical protein [Cesiribacter sp. SM1]